MALFKSCIKQQIKQDAFNFRARFRKDLTIAISYAEGDVNNVDKIKLFTPSSTLKSFIDGMNQPDKESFIAKVLSVLDALDEGKDITDSIMDFTSIDQSLEIKMAAPLKRQQFKMASLEKINPEDAEYMTSYQVFSYLDEKDPHYNNITATMVEKIKQSNVLYNAVGRELEDKVINQNKIDL